MAAMHGDALPAWVVRHPAQWGIIAGAGVAAVGLGLFGGQIWLLAVGLVFGLFNWLLWRPGGPAHAWRAWVLKRYPRHT